MPCIAHCFFRDLGFWFYAVRHGYDEATILRRWTGSFYHETTEANVIKDLMQIQLRLCPFIWKPDGEVENAAVKSSKASPPVKRSQYDEKPVVELTV